MLISSWHALSSHICSWHALSPQIYTYIFQAMHTLCDSKCNVSQCSWSCTVVSRHNVYICKCLHECDLTPFLQDDFHKQRGQREAWDWACSRASAKLALQCGSCSELQRNSRCRVISYRRHFGQANGHMAVEIFGPTTRPWLNQASEEGKPYAHLGCSCWLFVCLVCFRLLCKSPETMSKDWPDRALRRHRSMYCPFVHPTRKWH